MAYTNTSANLNRFLEDLDSKMRTHEPTVLLRLHTKMRTRENVLLLRYDFTIAQYTHKGQHLVVKLFISKQVNPNLIRRP